MIAFKLILYLVDIKQDKAGDFDQFANFGSGDGLAGCGIPFAFKQSA